MPILTYTEGQHIPEEEPNREIKIWNSNYCLKKQTDELKPVLSWCDVHTVNDTLCWVFISAFCLHLDTFMPGEKQYNATMIAYMTDRQ